MPWVVLEDMDGVDLELVASYLERLPGIRVDTMTMNGYEEWWYSDDGPQGDGVQPSSSTEVDGANVEDEQS